MLSDNYCALELIRNSDRDFHDGNTLTSGEIKELESYFTQELEGNIDIANVLDDDDYIDLFYLDYDKNPLEVFLR